LISLSVMKVMLLWLTTTATWLKSWPGEGDHYSAVHAYITLLYVPTIFCAVQEIFWAQENNPTKCQKAISFVFEQREHVMGCILLKSTHGPERIYGRAQRA
jgi:hypothetical protein